MTILKKSAGRDFTVLNISDVQLTGEKLQPGHPSGDLVRRTLDELVRRTSPDLITFTGDFAHTGDESSYRLLADLIESYGIPWAPVWGNHDHEHGHDFVKGESEYVASLESCLFEAGDEALGLGNYVIGIEEEGRLCHLLFMLDTHGIMEYTLADGRVVRSWGEVTQAQTEWYRSELSRICGDTLLPSTVIMHVPPFTYNAAFEAAFDDEHYSIAETAPDHNEACWREGFESSVGINHEGPSTPAVENGFIDMLREVGSTTHVLAGHNHINNSMINYGGVWLMYTLKLGDGGYWEPAFNGGTVLKIGTSGITEKYHEYVKA